MRTTELPEKADTFAARFAEEVATGAAEAAQSISVIEPDDPDRSEEEGLELSGPCPAFNREPFGMIRGKTLGVKIHMMPFVGEDEIAKLDENGVSRVPLHQAVVAGPCEFSDHENLQLEVHTQRLSDDAKQAMGPVSGDRRAAETRQETPEQPRVLLFFGNKERQRGAVIGVVCIAVPRVGEEAAAVATFAELKVGERTCQQAGRYSHGKRGCFPVRFGTIETVFLEVAEPVFGVHAG